MFLKIVNAMNDIVWNIREITLVKCSNKNYGFSYKFEIELFVFVIVLSSFVVAVK